MRPVGFAPLLARFAGAAKRVTWPGPSLLGVLAALLFALAARLPYFVGSDFPLNDGGMFFAMSRDILNSHFALPASTSYNLEDIPFAYPPLSFYLVAIVSKLLGVETVTLVRYLPLLANLATVAAVAVLARSLLGSGWAALIGPIIFALIPRSYEWMIMGGGLTRSIGFLCAVTCLSQVRELYSRPTVGRAVLCATFSALALAAHIELGLFLLYSLFLMALFYGRSVRALLLTSLIALSMVALTAPWWATVISRHGLAPFDAASLTGGWSTLEEQLGTLERFASPPSRLLRLLGTFAFLGAVLCFIRGELFLPLWLPLIFVLTPRSAPSEGAVPLALLAAVGLGEVVGPGIASAIKYGRPSSLLITAGALVRRLPRSRGTARAATVASLILLLSAVFAYWPGVHVTPHSLDSLSVADRQAMRWVAENAEETAKFLVLTTTWSWEEDHVGEWFPVVARRKSVLTPQGSEWLPSELHARKVCLWGKVRDLGVKGKGTEDLDEWASSRGIVYSHIYVSKGVRGTVDWTKLIASARKSPDYTMRIDNAEVAVLERNEPLKPRWETSGELVVSPDCQSLADESKGTQRAFEAAHGPLAARAWVEEHHQAIGKRATLCSRLSQFGLVGSVCRGTSADTS